MKKTIGIILLALVLCCIFGYAFKDLELIYVVKILGATILIAGLIILAVFLIFD